MRIKIFKVGVWLAAKTGAQILNYTITYSDDNYVRNMNSFSIAIQMKDAMNP